MLSNEKATRMLGVTLRQAMDEEYWAEETANNVEVDGTHRELWVHHLTEDGADRAAEVVETFVDETTAEFDRQLHADVSVKEYANDHPGRVLHVGDLYFEN